MRWRVTHLSVALSLKVYLKVGLSLSKKKLLKKCVICLIESPLKMVKNAFYFILKALFVLKIIKSLSRLFGHVGKRLDLKDKVNFEIHDVTAWFTNNCNTHFAQYLTK